MKPSSPPSRATRAGKPGMSKLDKILYLADMSSAERDWPGVNKLRRLERKDLDAAMLMALKQTNDFVLSAGQAAGPHVKGSLRRHSGAGGGPRRKALKFVLPIGNENRLQIVGKDAILKGTMDVNRPRMKKLEEI